MLWPFIKGFAQKLDLVPRSSSQGYTRSDAELVWKTLRHPAYNPADSAGNISNYGF